MKILIIEDDQHIATYLKKGLELKSYIVDVAHNGDQGLTMIEADHYDLLILDRMLPGLDGMQVCQEIRDLGMKIPILMLTAKNEIEDRVAGLDCGADDYLGKPFAFAELLARVRALTRRPQEQQNNKLQVANLVLDQATSKVELAGQELDLTKQEYALLEFFMRHPGQIFSTDQLAEKAWSYDSEILANTVQVYIGYLRNKIDKAFPQEIPLLKTVRGFGYKLSANQTNV